MVINVSILLFFPVKPADVTISACMFYWLPLQNKKIFKIHFQLIFKFHWSHSASAWVGTMPGSNTMICTSSLHYNFSLLWWTVFYKFHHISHTDQLGRFRQSFPFTHRCTQNFIKCFCYLSYFANENMFWNTLAERNKKGFHGMFLMSPWRNCHTPSAGLLSIQGVNADEFYFNKWHILTAMNHVLMITSMPRCLEVHLP